MNLGHIFAPPKIPIGIFRPSEPEPPSLPDTVAISIGPGGPNGPGQGFPGPAVHPAVRQEPKGPMRVSSGIEGALLVRKTLPIYPPIGREMRVEGTVVLAATISKAGTIENLHVVGGPAVLRQAAIDAVQTWLYRPYLLDGEPVEVETTVNVIFTLSR